jgi:CheY-like chemotaxis protein
MRPDNSCPHTPASLSGRNILIVDDDPAVREVFNAYIQTLHCYNVDLAANREEFLEQFRPGKYFAVILDLLLGESLDDGMDIAEEIRKIDDDVLIIVVSAYNPPFDERLLHNINAALVKPVDMQMLQSNLFLWALEYNRRMAIKHYIDRRVMHYRAECESICKALDEINEMLVGLALASKPRACSDPGE